MFRVAVLQFAPAFGATDANLDHVESMIEGLQTDLLVLPELFASGYWFESEEQLRGLAEPLDGPTLERVRRWSNDLDRWR